MRTEYARESHSCRLAVLLAMTLCLGAGLFAAGAVVSEDAEAGWCVWPFKPSQCGGGFHTAHSYYEGNSNDFTMGRGDLVGYGWHVRGGFVRTCWVMRSDGYSRIRMAAQLEGGSNKQTVEKVIDRTRRVYCDAATAKVYNRTDVESWLRILEGAHVSVTYASAQTLTDGR